MAGLRRLFLLAAVLTVFAVGAADAHASCPGSSTEPTAANLPTVKAATLCLLNERRARDGLAPLAADSTLENAATRFSLRMVAERFFAHVAPDGTNPVDRVLAAGLRLTGDWALGENIGYGTSSLSTPNSLVQRWMDSPGHRTNILTDAFRTIGIGVAIGTPVTSPSSGATYTTDFAFSPKPQKKSKKAKKAKRKKCRKRGKKKARCAKRTKAQTRAQRKARAR